MNAETIARALDGRRSGAGWICRCPAHEDDNPSLSVGDGENGVVVKCFAGCSQAAVIAALRARGLWPERHDVTVPRKRKPRRRLGTVVAEYDYRDERGQTLFQVVRFEPKDFRQRRPDGSGGWLWNLKGARRVLYRLPELLSADVSETVFIVEGEKDCDTLASLDLMATTNPQGAGKWGKVDDSPLEGRPVAIVADNDEPGHLHATQVATALHGKASSVKVVALPKPAKDVSDWVRSGGTKERLLAIVEAAPTFAPTDTSSDEDSTNDADQSYSVGERDPLTGKLILSPSDPLPSARVFLRQKFWREDVLTLRLYAGVFFAWRENRYVLVEMGELRFEVYRFTENAVRPQHTRNGEIDLVPYQPTSHKVSSLIDAIKAETFLTADLTPPAWLVHDDALPPPDELLPCKGGTLHIPTREWIDPTPKLFATSALPFDFNPDAPKPERWIRFLSELWRDDPQSVETLQEWFGYCLTGDTSQQKMLLLVGPRRGGKGTIGRILRAIVGAGNVVGPTTSSLATPFGLQPLIGKSLAIVSDARFAGRPDSAIVLERLLCISGEDTLTVPRKYLGDMTMKLPTRFMFLTNELPRVADTAGALVGRFVVLTLRSSFFGREDVELTNKLVAELPGILLWAIEGWERLRDRGHFVQPESSGEAVGQLADLASPVSAFIREWCVVGSGYQCELWRLYAAWKKWCHQHGRDRPGTDTTFSRDLAAALPGLKRTRPRDGKNRPVTFVGIGLVQAGTCTEPLYSENEPEGRDSAGCDPDPEDPPLADPQDNAPVHVPACTTSDIGPGTPIGGERLFPEPPPSGLEAFEV